MEPSIYIYIKPWQRIQVSLQKTYVLFMQDCVSNLPDRSVSPKNKHVISFITQGEAVKKLKLTHPCPRHLVDVPVSERHAHTELQIFAFCRELTKLPSRARNPIGYTLHALRSDPLTIKAEP